jgi:hypothetical protein
MSTCNLSKCEQTVHALEQLVANSVLTYSSSYTHSYTSDTGRLDHVIAQLFARRLCRGLATHHAFSYSNTPTFTATAIATPTL